MATIKQKKWTYEEYYNLDDDKRYELIEGEFIEMSPAPTYFHQSISAKLFYKLYNYTENSKLGETRYAPLDIIFDETNILQPDIIFISNENKNIITEKGVFGSPDLVIEVLSPSTKEKDRKTKFKIYEKFKVKEYWIVDPDNKTAEVYSLGKDKLVLFFSEKDKIISKLIPGLEILLKDIFS